MTRQADGTRKSVVSQMTVERWALRPQMKVLALLDALVRNTRGESSPPELLERLCDAWREQPELMVGFGPTHLDVDGNAAARHQAEGSWTYGAFMAGLRRVGLTEETGAADLQRLAHRVASLRLDAEQARRFRDWAWEEDGEGLRLVVTQTFSEVFDRASKSFGSDSTSLRALRVQGALPLGVQVLVDPADVDRAAVRPEYEVPLQGYRRAAQHRGLEVDGTELRTLTAQVGDGGRWAAEELETVLEFENLRRGLPPLRASHRLLALWQGKGPQQAVRIAARVEQVDPEYGQRIRKGLSARRLAQAISDNPAAASQEFGEAFAGWLEQSESFAVEVLRQLAQGTAEPGPQRPLFEQLLTGPKVASIVHALAHPGLDAHAAAWLASRTPEAALDGFIEGLPLVARAHALGQIPVQTLLEHRHWLEPVFADAAAREPVFERLLETSEAVAAALLPDAVWAGRKLPWSSARLATLVCHRVHGLLDGRALLGRLARSRRVDPGVRVAALQALYPSPDSLRRACRWSIVELLDPQPVRDAFKRARQRLRAA